MCGLRHLLLFISALLVLLLPRLFFYYRGVLLLRRLPFFAVLQYRGGLFASFFLVFCVFSVATECCILVFFWLMFRLRFSVFSFLTLLPAALHLSLGSIISNKRTLYCFVSSICLLVCCCLWVVCACECRYWMFLCMCVSVTARITIFVAISSLVVPPFPLSRPNFRNRHRKGNVGS